MPRVALTRDQRDRQRWEDEDREFVAQMGAWQAVTGNSLEQLAVMCGMTRSTMYNRKKRPWEITREEYRKIMNVIGNVGLVGDVAEKPRTGF